jgi:hypothetical protein
VGRCCRTVLLRSWRFVILYGWWLRGMVPSSVVGSWVFSKILNILRCVLLIQLQRVKQRQFLHAQYYFHYGEVVDVTPCGLDPSRMPSDGLQLAARYSNCNSNICRGVGPESWTGAHLINKCFTFGYYCLVLLSFHLLLFPLQICWHYLCLLYKVATWQAGIGNADI